MDLDDFTFLLQVFNNQIQKIKFLAYSTDIQDIESRVLKVVSAYDKITAAKVKLNVITKMEIWLFIISHFSFVAYKGLTFHPRPRFRFTGSCGSYHGDRGRVWI